VLTTPPQNDAEREGRKQPLSDAEWLALLHSLAVSNEVIEDDSRKAIYGTPRGW